MPYDQYCKRAQYQPIQNRESLRQLRDGGSGLSWISDCKFFQLIRVILEMIEADPHAHRDKTQQYHHNNRKYLAVHYSVLGRILHQELSYL